MTDEHKDNCPHCDGDITEHTAGLRSALQTEREAARTNAKKAKKANGLIDELRESAGVETPEELTDFVKTAQAGEEIDKLNNQVADLTKQVDELSVTNAKLQDDAEIGKISAAITNARGNVKMLMPHVRQALKDDPNMDVESFVASMRADDAFAGAFAATDMSGSGSEPQKGGDGPSTLGRGMHSKPLRRSTMTDREKVDYQKQYGLDALLDLPQ